MREPKLKLLIVDDEVSIRASLADIFISDGHDVRTSADASSALEQIRKETPDVLISDLNMPGMSGFELLSTVRRNYPDIQVIAMSAAYLDLDIAPLVAADAFYAKGRSNPRMLIQMIHSLIPPPPETRFATTIQRGQL